jgi:exodeoxyribonuclease V gamma subunit
MLIVYKSNRLEILAEALAGVLREPLPSPVMPEWVGVQTQGVGVWLGMEISRRLGVWSNVHSPYPRAMIEEIFKLVLGEDSPDTTRFEPERLTWSVMDLLPGLLDRPEFSPLSAYVAGDRKGLKRYQLSRRIAETFDRYAIYRPDVVLAWEEETSGSEENLSPENWWQPVLWRTLVSEHGASHVAAVAKRSLAALAHLNECPHGLPPRISLFGISTLPPLYINILSNLPDCVSVNLFMLSPSREHWAYIRSRREIIRELSKTGADGDQLETVLGLEEGNRLLASLGRLGRDFQGVLEGSADYLEPEENHYSDPGEESLLHTIQSDILNLRLRGAGDGVSPRAVDPDDDSIQVHVCHSPMREVQVLRDRLQGVFQECPDIFPHDVIVMVPDIDTYAPFVEAVFGSGDDTALGIPHSVSDRGAAEESPVIRAFLEILRMVQGRLPVREVLDLLAMDPVRERFDLSEEEMTDVSRWVLDAGIRWGLDGEHRRSFGQPARRENTWRFGLERLFLGLAMPDSPPAIFQGALPYPGIEGTSGEVLGKAASFFYGLFDFMADAADARSVSEWRTLLCGGLSRFVQENGKNQYQHRMVQDAIGSLGRIDDSRDLRDPVELSVVYNWLTEAFRQRPGIHGFLSGGVTFCNLLPMRSIPFKVVCLLGLGDTDFPRSMTPDGFDLAAAIARAGDRSVRNDDRYLFLEALLSAREKLYISYVGRAVSDNSILPPSVVVGELLDAVAEGFAPTENEGNTDGILGQMVTEHPLQPFHPSYFDTSDDSLFSFSPEHLAGAEALTGLRQPRPVFLDEELGAREDERLSLSIPELIGFYRMPVVYFLRKRLGVILKEFQEEAAEREPLSLQALERYGEGEYLLSHAVRNEDLGAFTPIMMGRGRFPLGTPGRLAMEDLYEEVRSIVETVNRAGMESEHLDPMPVAVETAQGLLSGKIDRVLLLDDMKARILCTYGGVNEHRKLSLWIYHLLINADESGAGPAFSLAVGMNKKKVETFALGPVPDAGDRIRELAEIFDQGMATPLPLFPKASCAYADAWLSAEEEEREDKALEAARKKFFSGFGKVAAEADHQAIRYGFGGRDPLLETGELGFSSLALRVFGPMLRAEIPAEDILRGEGAP